jgi:hypothetical protein
VTSLHDGNIVFTSPLLSMSQHWWNFVDVISNTLDDSTVKKLILSQRSLYRTFRKLMISYKKTTITEIYETWHTISPYNGTTHSCHTRTHVEIHLPRQNYPIKMCKLEKKASTTILPCSILNMFNSGLWDINKDMKQPPL